jgi:16S rRNA (adenine(1408)-N(1))-methyltransferase
VIGVDADAASMVEISRRAARERLPNALFVVASVEDLPPELDEVADIVRIHFPWGSLLRGIATADATIVGPLARVCGIGGAVTALVSIMDRDARVGARLPDDPAALARGFARHGLALTEMRPATQDEVVSARSSWAKRLGAGSRRPVMLLRWARRPGQGRAC